jgi:hypothetical protein
MGMRLKKCHSASGVKNLSLSGGILRLAQADDAAVLK